MPPHLQLAVSNICLFHGVRYGMCLFHVLFYFMCLFHLYSFMCSLFLYIYIFFIHGVCCTATHCNALQHTATHCSTRQHTATHCNTLQHIAIHCNPLQHTAICFSLSMLWHVSISCVLFLVFYLISCVA